jgi:hypothetical protein
MNEINPLKHKEACGQERMTYLDNKSHLLKCDLATMHDILYSTIYNVPDRYGQNLEKDRRI